MKIRTVLFQMVSLAMPKLRQPQDGATAHRIAKVTKKEFSVGKMLHFRWSGFESWEASDGLQFNTYT